MFSADQVNVIEMEALLDAETGRIRLLLLLTGITKVRALIKISQVQRQRFHCLRIASDAALSMDDQQGDRINTDKIDALCEVGSAALDLL